MGTGLAAGSRWQPMAGKGSCLPWDGDTPRDHGHHHWATNSGQWGGLWQRLCPCGRNLGRPRATGDHTGGTGGTGAAATPFFNPQKLPAPSQPRIPPAVLCRCHQRQAGICAHRNSRFGAPTHPLVTLCPQPERWHPCRDVLCGSSGDGDPPSRGRTGGCGGDRAGALGSCVGTRCSPGIDSLPAPTQRDQNRRSCHCRQRREAELGSAPPPPPLPRPPLMRQTNWERAGSFNWKLPGSRRQR